MSHVKRDYEAWLDANENDGRDGQRLRQEICDRWANVLGVSWSFGADPPDELTPESKAEYAVDMKILREISPDPAADVVDAIDRYAARF